MSGIIVSKILKMNFKEATNQLLATVKLEDLCDRLGIETKRSGSSVKALCQFHKDTKPSMELYDDNPEKSAFHCFSCGAHGDIFALVKEVKGMDFREAHTWLCDEYNITLDRVNSELRTSSSANPFGNLTENVYQYALDFYKRHQSEAELDAFLKERGYTLEFGKSAGLCLVGIRSLVNHLNSLEYPDDVHKLYVLDKYESAGLIKKSLITDGENTTINLRLENLYYDHFRKGRLLFPIRDDYGEIKGFAGRLTTEGSGPKYLFSKGMNKSMLLYRSESAFSNINKSRAKTVSLYLCEGLFDALRLESCGFNSVAVLGASLTDEQCEKLQEVAHKLSKRNRFLELNLFFDNDSSGLKASDLSIRKIIKNIGLDSVNIKVYYSKNESKVDPDSYLRGKSSNLKESLKSIEFPFPAINLCQELNISPSEIEDNDYFKDLPYSMKIRASKRWHQLFDDKKSELVIDEFEAVYSSYDWFKLLKRTSLPKDVSKNYNKNAFINDTQQRLQLAFSISKSAMSNTGQFPDNDAEWRRVEMCLPILEIIIKDRFSLNYDNLSPIEPLNTIYVSRDISDKEFREMSLHCVEDLTSHQYILSELLTERCDYIDDFSLNIPATRYYRKSNTTVTTGEGGKSEHNLTLSFAYQVDMEVIEGREVSNSHGMFRPYFDCWKDFTKSINSAAMQMDQVNMVRLDLKRYYDRLKRYVLQDALRDCIPDDLSKYEERHLLELVQDNGTGKKSKTIDWLLEQVFGYKKYEPKKGHIHTSDKFVGIPQGPDISSYLANIVLFQVDSVARKFIEESKDQITEKYTAWYARYVDDMVLIAENPATLSRLRIVIEEAVRKLELELVAKEQPAAMTAEEFGVYLTKGKALAASGPTGIVELADTDDVYSMGRIERYQALALLNNKDLFSDDIDTIKSKLNMAMHCSQLRFSDVKKVAKWVWFISVKELESPSSRELVSNYQKSWLELIKNMDKQFDPENCPWEDPLLLSFDGLNQLISRNSVWVNDSLSQEDIVNKEKIRNILIKNINIDLVSILVNENPRDISGWGISKTELARIFWQKNTALLWHAKQYSEFEFRDINSLGVTSKLIDTHTLKSSLVRMYFSELQISNDFKYVAIESTYSSPLRNLCLMLQVVYLHLAYSDCGEDDDLDILSPIMGELRSFSRNDNDLVSNIVFSFLIPGENRFSSDEYHELAIRVLYFICSLTSNSKLIRLLSSRWERLINDTLFEGDFNLISPLPTIREHALYGYHLDQNETIDSLVKVRTESVSNIDDDIPSHENNDLYVSHSEGICFSNWIKSENSPEHLIVENTSGGVLKEANSILRTPPPMVKEVNKNLLNWVANTYRSLIDCIQEGRKIPTWCNTSMSSLPIGDVSPDANNVCIISSRDRITAYPQAFIRNGGKSLRPVQVPSHNVCYWQAGVALTDMLGFTRDLDAYANVDEAFDTASEPPQTRLLKNSLKKLNGSMYFSKPAYPSKGENVPKSIERTLHLLERFPETVDPNDTYLFGFISEMETQLMRIRLSGQTDSTVNGKLVGMYAEAVRSTLARVPLDWFSHLPSVTVKDLSGLRIVERFWVVLHEIFRQSFDDCSLSNDVDELDTIKKAILLGCQVNLIEASLKAAVFESQAASEINANEFKHIDIEEVIASGFFESNFSLSKYALSENNEESSFEKLGSYFLERLKDKAQQYSFSGITPLGWLLIAMVKKGLISQGSKNLDVQHKAVREHLANSVLVKLLTIESKQLSDGRWPLEHELPDLDLDSVLDSLTQLHSASTVKLIEVEKQHFDYDSQKGAFKGLWKLKKWQVALAASNAKDSKPFYEAVGNRLVSSWTETYVGDNLVYVSSLGKLYGSILEQVSVNSSHKSNEQVPSQSKKVSIPISFEELFGEQASSNDKQEQPLNDDESIVAKDGNANDIPILKGEYKGTPLAKALERLVGINRTSWDLRKDSRALSHSRIAMFQIDLKERYGDGYYTHYSKNEELLDSCSLGNRCKEIRDALRCKDIEKLEREALLKEQQGCKTNDKCSKLYEELTLFNKAEARRRSLLKGVIESCVRLGVDLLVLPEYSVQPATIVWLKDLLRGKELSVLAGTYRLPEGYPRSKLQSLTSEEYSSVVRDFQSVMTLLVPYQGDKVLCFNRAKKYASPAANELISPYQDKIEPLFTLDMLEKHLRGEFSGEALGLKDITELMKTRHISLLGFIQELICAELFLLTNPVNYLNLATEFQNLSNKFGIIRTNTSDEAVQAVLDDIKNISFHLSGDTGDQIPSFQSFRRSIVTIPAMTSRKQDYWIFGQGAMLANGISTIFCNALCGKESTGGSCFIGLDSWIGDKKKPFITPYSGWSKGIYYGSKTDTLQKEQSLVVVDIDPKMMSLGSPRPQSLPVPMKLVAHVPVIELKLDEKSKISMLNEAISSLEDFLNQNRNTVTNPEFAEELIKTLESWFDMACDEDQKLSLKSRLDAWKEGWRVNPQVGIAALTDWIAIEVSTLSEGTLDD
ncbi:toprim domain-containing protein [Vibrio parahaemolyticus]|nr:toprim domain-containing protein [Vibrio parahaemolyticus]EJC7041524.1 toprim domain-containing protein [Vibrio parahaemolyticus]